MFARVTYKNCGSSVSVKNSTCWKCEEVISDSQLEPVKTLTGFRWLFGFDGSDLPPKN
jgi:hypothetical protein